MRRSNPAWRSILCLGLCLAVLGVGSRPARAQTAPSLLQPGGTLKSEFSMVLDAVDPTAQSNPRGAGRPGGRADHQLVLYTPAFGPSTRTTEPGLEVIVIRGIVTGLAAADSPIPADGFVLSGHGSAAQWLQKIIKPGALVHLQEDGRRLRVQYTPAVYIHQVQTAFRRAEGRSPVNGPAYQAQLDAARTCLSELQTRARQGLSPALAALAAECEAQANRAFYQTLHPVGLDMRGVWLRPDSKQPEIIRERLAALKSIGVRDVFLETYYQGRTLYPSAVMAEYGLPTQHGQFEGSDPMKLWVDEAHAQGLRVHAWVQVFFAGNARESLETYGPILNHYPQWRNVQRLHIDKSEPVASNIEAGHYFLDPANPEVRTFLEKLILEIVTQYPVDGLNLDYIRYPSSPAPDKPTFLQSSWGYTEAARQQFKVMIEKQRQEESARQAEAAKKAGIPYKPVDPKTLPKSDPRDLSPDHPLWPQWVQFRKDQVTGFVQSVTRQVKAARPNLTVSAVVFPWHANDPNLVVKLQDWPVWARNGLVDAFTPIGLTPNYEGMRAQSARFQEVVQGKVPVYVGIFAMYNRMAPVDLAAQIEAVNEAGLPGVVLFDGSRLTPEYQEVLREGAFRDPGNHRKD